MRITGDVPGKSDSSVHTYSGRILDVGDEDVDTVRSSPAVDDLTGGDSEVSRLGRISVSVSKLKKTDYFVISI